MMERITLIPSIIPLLSVVRQRLAGSEKLRVKEFCKTLKTLLNFWT